MTVDEIYQLVLYATAKNLQNGYIGPDDFNLTINTAQKSYAAYLLGNFQTYAPGRPVSKVELGQNSVVRQRLSPVIYGYNLAIDGTGFSPYPGDYAQADAMFSIYGFQRIRYVQQDALYSHYNSVIDPIATNSIYLIEDNGFRFYPTTTASAKLSYVRNPPNMVWGYTDDADGLPVYDAAKSTQPVWDDLSILEIVVRALAIIGVNLQFGDVSRYAEQIKQGGQ